MLRHGGGSVLRDWDALGLGFKLGVLAFRS